MGATAIFWWHLRQSGLGLQLALDVLVCAVLASCASSDLGSKAAPEAALAGLPPPGMLLTRSASTAPPECMGDEFSSLIMPQNVGDDNAAGRFSPAWTSADPAFTNLAYALYELNSGGAVTYAELRMQWDADAAPAPGNLWVALADWPAGVWRWSQSREPASAFWSGSASDRAMSGRIPGAEVHTVTATPSPRTEQVTFILPAARMIHSRNPT